MIKAAHLRVYVPAERAGRWDLQAGGSRTRRNVLRTSDHFIWEEPVRDDAIVVAWNGAKYVCPRFSRLRMLEGVLALQNVYPGFGSAMLPDAAVRAAASELESIRSTSPEARSYILTSPWHVPLRWFTAFDPDSREVRDSGNRKSIRYRSRVDDARIRVEYALDVLEDAGFDGDTIEMVRDLARWLDEFAGDCLLELDYGRTAELFTDGELALDESAAEIRDSLNSLHAGDFGESGNRYASVAGRWARGQALQYVN